MNDSDKALEHLQVIRGLMEKATVYRAVSVPTAIIGGLLALVASAMFYIRNEQFDTGTIVFIWLGVAFLVNAIHHGLIWKTAQKEGEAYPSSGLRMALKALIPPMFVGGDRRAVVLLLVAVALVTLVLLLAATTAAAAATEVGEEQLSLSCCNAYSYLSLKKTILKLLSAGKQDVKVT